MKGIGILGCTPGLTRAVSWHVARVWEVLGTGNQPMVNCWFGVGLDSWNPRK